MKKIIIVNNNMKVGGVQKSLCNLLREMEGQYDMTLCLFAADGVYLEQLPPSVKVITCRGPVRYLGLSQGQCRGIHKLIRGGLAVLCRLLGRDRVMKLILAGTRRISGEYDHAIAFLHNGRLDGLYGGVQEFVLSHIRAKVKTAFLHCDYGSCGANTARNNRIISRFDRIAACSDGCRRVFEKLLPQLAEKCVTVRNFQPYDEIRALAAAKPVTYEAGWIHGVTVARLAHEKGIERAIAAVDHARAQGFSMKLHIVGSGAMEQQLRELTQQRQLQDRVIFYGEQANPYPYMAAADLFLLTSYHEAAPMVIDEAVCLGLPVLTVQTTSSHEMVTQRGAGWVCDNDQAALNAALVDILRQEDALNTIKTGLRTQAVDNSAAAEQLRLLIEG